MISPRLLEILVCPENHQELTPADAELVARCNRAVQAGRLLNRAGLKVERPLDGGLVRRDGAILYPIIDGIPVMLIDEGISLDRDF